ncbi:hypothetical protein K469DRAFT_548723, partial [Zopfia rhizophila CBS 207.26]
KKKVLDQPFFCDVIHTSEGGCILKDKAFPYAKYRDIFVRLGRVAGFEESLELYQLQRASRRNINSVLDPVERNQTVGHLGSTYEKYYTPTHIARDFQAIYFGTPLEEELIRSVASMGLSRDRRAPTELNDDQQKEAKREIGSTYQKLHRIRLDEAIRAFHDSVDTIEIARQLSGKAATEVLTLPTVEFELGERAAIAGMLFKPAENDKARVKFVRTLARLCQLQETHQPKALKRKKMDFGSEVVKQEPDASKCEEIVEVQSRHLYPMVPPHPVCLICIGNKESSYEWRMRHKPRKDVLKKHVKTHFRLPKYQGEFQCRHPNCSDMLDGMMHFKRHAFDVHGVSH